jgi:hypothetical protein
VPPHSACPSQSSSSQLSPVRNPVTPSCCKSTQLIPSAIASAHHRMAFAQASNPAEAVHAVPLCCCCCQHHSMDFWHSCTNPPGSSMCLAATASSSAASTQGPDSRLAQDSNTSTSHLKEGHHHSSNRVVQHTPTIHAGRLSHTRQALGSIENDRL